MRIELLGRRPPSATTGARDLMRTGARGRLDAALRWSPAQLVFRLRAANHLTVLAYHGVDDPDRFAGQLDHLVRVGRPVALDDLTGALAGRRPLPERAVLLTFDDGERSLLEAGLPLLREHGLPAVAFVVVGLLDTQEPFWWTEVEQLARAANGPAGPAPATLVRQLKARPDRERLEVLADLRRAAPTPPAAVPQLRRDELPLLEAAGVAVGNHTMTHAVLPRCDDAKVAAEVGQAHRILEAALGHPPAAFAYPNGDWDERAERHLTELGYAAGFLFDHRVSPRAPGHRLRVSRVRVNSDTSLDRFAAIVSGLHPALHHARGGA
jgi:peptidoglycan/xylan/chitin deacetylase (PgdA/CDA1 family)